jgi:hypothetical protein
MPLSPEQVRIRLENLEQALATAHRVFVQDTEPEEALPGDLWTTLSLCP